MNVWDQIDEMKQRFEADMANATEAAKLLGYKTPRCSSNLKWTANANTAQKFEAFKLRDLGPCDSSAELVAAMKTAQPQQSGLTEADNAAAAAFLGKKRPVSR